MWWRATDTATGAEQWLALPRRPAGDARSLAAWERDGRLMARLDHPQLLGSVQAGVEAGWPWIGTQQLAGDSLEAWLAKNPPPAPEQSVRWICDVLQALAFVHEAGFAHGDLASYSVLIDGQGRALLMPGGVALATAPPVPAGSATPDLLKRQREAGARDMLACGLLLHRLLAGVPALDETDPPTAVERVDREIVRLGWSTPQPVPEPLRAIVNRSTERDPARRYLGARSLQRALQGWLDAQAEGGGGALSLVLERLHSVGHLPAMPGLVERMAELATGEQQRIAELADLVLQDPALALELLRQVNVALYAARGDASVTTVRRAIALIGIEGLRHIANGLRPWPGALDDAMVGPMTLGLRDALRSAHLARLICPADMDGESVYLIALLQHLGPLLASYHLPEETAQVRSLVEPPPPARAMSESAAACAVLGVDFEALGIAVARHWGLDESLLAAMRRVSTDAPVRMPDDRDDMRRVLASAAVEAVASLASREARAGHAAVALGRVTQRYARALTLAPGELGAALQSSIVAVPDAVEPPRMQPRAA